MQMKMKSAKNNVDTPTYTICVNIDLQYVNECVCVYVWCERYWKRNDACIINNKWNKL